jgi:hypothetical protein
MLDAGKATKVRADFREDRHDGGDRQAVDARQVDPRPACERRARVKVRRVFAAALAGTRELDFVNPKWLE